MLIYVCVYRGLSCLFIHEGASHHGQDFLKVGVLGYIKMTGKHEPISKTERASQHCSSVACIHVPRITALTSFSDGV